MGNQATIMCICLCEVTALRGHVLKEETQQVCHCHKRQNDFHIVLSSFSQYLFLMLCCIFFFPSPGPCFYEHSALTCFCCIFCVGILSWVPYLPVVKDEGDEGTRWDAEPSILRTRWSSVTGGLVMRGWIPAHKHPHRHRPSCMCTHKIIQYIIMHSQLHPVRFHSSSATLLSRYVPCLITGR